MSKDYPFSGVKNTYSKKFKKREVNEWKKVQGSTSLSKFCKKRGISPRSLMRWYKDDRYNNSPDKKVSTATPSPEYKYLITQESLIISFEGDVRVLSKSESNFKTVTAKLLEGDFSEAWVLCNIKGMIDKFSNGSVTVEGDVVKVCNIPVSNVMTKKLVDMLRMGEKGVLDFSNFMQRLLTNSDKRVIEELYNFLKFNDIELNPDGSFYGYKAVTHNYLDKRTGKIDNSIGAIPVMPRSGVNSDKNVSCSSGLHVGSLEYATNFASKGDIVVKVKVWPEDVVSVPLDYNGQKLRTCRYEVESMVFVKGAL